MGANHCVATRVKARTHTGEGEQKDGVIHSLDTPIFDLSESVMKIHLKCSAEALNN